MTVRTYWLYGWPDVPIYCVRAPVGASDAEVRAAALAEHYRVPLCYPEAPYAFAERLRTARIARD